jgi:hypothetical protein
MPFLLPRILSWGRLLPADWLSPGVAGVTLVPRLCRSCRGQATFAEAAVGGILSSLPGSGSPRWSRQPTAGVAGPLDGAGLRDLAPWRFLGRQPANSAALGLPWKSSPRHMAYSLFLTRRFNYGIIAAYHMTFAGTIFLGGSPSTSLGSSRLILYRSIVHTGHASKFSYSSPR